MGSKKKKGVSFSKVLLIVDYAIAVALVVVGIIYAFKSDSYSNPITSMVEVWIGQAALVSGMYLWKAKCENRAKYAQEWFERMVKAGAIPPEQTDAAIRMVELITKD